MAADFKTKYDASPLTLTVTNLHSLASSSTRTAGWTSAWIVNTTTLALDYMVSGELKVHNSVAPTADRSLEVWAYAVHGDGSAAPTLFSSGTPGTEGAATVTDEEIRDAGMILLWSAKIDAGTGDVYPMPARSIRQAFGRVPRKFALFVTQDSGQALHSAGNAFYADPIFEQSV